MWEVFEMLLKRDGVSIADVSRATGISQSVFSNWKRRKGKISAENAQKLADFFNVSVGYIFGVQEDERRVIWRSLIDQIYFDNDRNIKIVFR